MTLVARHCVVVALLVIVSVETAAAECAWVLWKEHTGSGGRGFPGGTNWMMESLWNERGECELRARMSVQREVQTWSGVPNMKVRTGDDGTLVAVVSPDGYWFQHFRCLPDTIDPRGPKGK
jgi:hypothetical protein